MGGGGLARGCGFPSPYSAYLALGLAALLCACNIKLVFSCRAIRPYWFTRTCSSNRLQLPVLVLTRRSFLECALPYCST